MRKLAIWMLILQEFEVYNIPHAYNPSCESWSLKMNFIDGQRLHANGEMNGSKSFLKYHNDMSSYKVP